MIVQHTSLMKIKIKAKEFRAKDLIHLRFLDINTVKTTRTQIISSVVLKVSKCPNIPSPRVYNSVSDKD